MTEEERVQTIEEALSNEYRAIWLWKPTPISHPFGPDDRDKVAEFAERVREMRVACVEALLKLPDEELKRIRDFKREPMEISTWPWSQILPERLHPSKLINRRPPKWSYGFGHPSFAPDFGYWAKMPSLSLMEATLLSVGVDPSEFTSDEIYKLKKK